MEIIAIVTGVSAGITYALTGLAKTQGEKFDWSKFVATIAVGAGAGLVMALSKLSMDALWNYVIAMSIVPAAENLIKAMYRKIWPKALSFLN